MNDDIHNLKTLQDKVKATKKSNNMNFVSIRILTPQN